MSWDPDSMTPEKLHRYRQAAESAWGDDTRSEEYIPHPNPAAGQCYVTSRWMTKHEGGDVGSKDGHYFWVSPDRSHVADITGDRGENPGPVKFKRADHPAYKGFKIAGPAAPDADRRAQLFAQRADHALHHGTKVSLDLMGPTYIGEDDDLDQRQFNESPFPMLHDDPTYEPEPQSKYNFVWVDGKLQMAPHDDHEQLLHQAGATGDEDGPTAVGYADIVKGHVTWRVASNVGLQSLRDVLLHYSKEIGWKFDGLVGIDGKPLGMNLGPVISYYWREKGDDVQIAKTPFKVAREIQVTGSTAYVDKLHPGLVEWAGDMGLKLAEYPGGGNMLDHMRVREDLEMYNNGDPKFQPGNVPAEFDLPKGPFVCDTCGAKPDTFDAYKLHMDGHQPKEDVVEDGHFPGLPLDDEPLGFGHNPKGIAGEATASVHPFIMELASTHEARRMPEFDERASWMGYDAPGNRIYGAYANGRIQGYAVLAGEYVLDAQGPTEAQRALWEHVAAGKGKEPKDMIEAAVPFVYDIPSDKLHIGYAGTTTHDVPGKISPGGLVEGYYEPGGKVTIQTYSTHPFSVRHLMDLWYHHAPQMEITSLEQLEKDGKSTKLASTMGWEPGSWGKGLIDQNSNLHTWNTQSEFNQVPQHNETLQQIHPEMDNKQRASYLLGGGDPIVIAPSGYYTANTPYPSENIVRFAQAHPALKYQPDFQKWWNRRAATTSAASEGMSVGPYIQGLLQSDVAASTAYKALRDAGGKVYAVGGAPRDALQGKIPNDIDLMVSGIPQPEVEHILNKLPGNATFAGKNYGVFHYHHGGDTVEIALPRSDDYGDGGRRGDGKVTVDPDLPIADDLRRRDFTANATAVDLDTGELVDPHGGADDIKRGVLRTTHPGSFREDPSRLIRALTMYGRFGLAPDEQTRHEMEANGHLLRGESPDLLNKTFTKTLKSDNPAAAVRLAHDTGLLSHLLPEVDNNWDYDQNNSHHKHSLGEHLLQVLDNTSRLTTDPDVRFAALMHDVGKPGSAWTDPSTGESHYYQSPNGEGGNHEDVGSQMTEDRLRKGFNLQRSRINRITHLISNHMFSPFTTPKGARRFVQKVGDENVDDLLNLREADQTGKGQSSAEVAARTSADSMRGLVNDARVSGETTGMNALSINGNDLLGMGMKPGPAVGQVLQSLQSEVVDDPSKNDPATLKGLAQQYIDAQP